MSKITDYFSLRGALYMSHARMQRAIEEGDYEGAMYENFNTLFLMDECGKAMACMTEEENRIMLGVCCVDMPHWVAAYWSKA